MACDSRSDFPSLTVIDHPLIRVRLSVLRDRGADIPTFRRALNDIARLMVFEITRDLPTREIQVSTPMETTTGAELARPLVMVPILRAGVGMLDGFREVLSEALVGYLGMYRDEETLEPKNYFSKLPDGLADSDVILIDPMLATGASSAEAASQLKEAGARPERIRFVSLISAPEGVRYFAEAHPDIAIYTACLDRGLNENAYIVPGLGDAGDRYFGT